MLAKRFVYFILVLISIVACKSDLQKRHEQVVANIEQDNIQPFLNIEFHVRNNVEFYDYYQGDTLICSWQYDIDSARFQQFDRKLMASISDKPLLYMRDLHDRIKKLNLELISQSSWKAQVLKFWVADNEYYTYVHPDFKFDDDLKSLLKNELKNSEKVSKCWYYKKLKVCRNK